MALISTEGTKAHYKRQFWSFLTQISQSKYKKLETLIRWHTVDSWLAYSGLMKNGVCQIFLKFAYWVTAFWIRWPDYLGVIRFIIHSIYRCVLKRYIYNESESLFESCHVAFDNKGWWTLRYKRHQWLAWRALWHASLHTRLFDAGHM